MRLILEVLRYTLRIRDTNLLPTQGIANQWNQLSGDLVYSFLKCVAITFLDVMIPAEMLHAIREWSTRLCGPFRAYTGMPFWRTFPYLLHWKLSKWQVPVQLMTKMSSKWCDFHISEQGWGFSSVIHGWCMAARAGADRRVLVSTPPPSGTTHETPCLRPHIKSDRPPGHGRGQAICQHPYTVSQKS